jgi:uncharacterized OB-fold protein
VSVAKPVPEVTEDLRPFFAAARQAELVVQRCRGCGQLRFPPRHICSGCLARDSEWVPVSGRGEIFSYNVMHQVYHPAFASEVPYPVVIVALEEGARMLSNLIDCPPEKVAIGLLVEVTFERVSDQVTLPKFRPR